MPSQLGERAEAYAKNGWYVFPLKPRDKTPLTAHGLKDASNKIEVVRSWWTRNPDANIGLNCGKSGLVVIDLDKRGEYDGLQEWDEIKSKNKITALTCISKTGGGGHHLIFKSPEGITIKNSAGKIAPGIDVRADGGYIVLPPSVHPSGNQYAWDNATQDIEPLPDLITQILTTEPDPWKIYTLIDAAQPRPPLEWVVDGVLTAGSLSIWYGAPGTLKSMLLADLCICVASGQKWLTKPSSGGGYVTHPGPAMWLDFDNGQRRTHERFGALARARKVNSDAPLFYVSMPSPYLDAGDKDSMGALANRIVARDVRLVVIDNLGVVSASVDENSADMQRPMVGLRWLAEATGAAVVVIHHQRKSNGYNTRSGETLRGHSCIEAAIDLGVLVSRDGENITMSATKVRGVGVKPFGASFSFENDQYHELLNARFWPYDLQDEKETEEEQTENNILQELTKFGPLSANQTYDRIGGNRAEVLDLIRRMVSNGKIGQRQGARGMLLYVPQDNR